MSVQATLLPTHTEKNLGAMKAERAVKCITFDRSEAAPRGDAVCFSTQAE